MSLKEEWEQLCNFADKALDDLSHLDAIAVLEREGARSVVLRIRISAGGDEKVWVDREATPDLLALELQAASAMQALHGARAQLVAKIIGAAL